MVSGADAVQSALDSMVALLDRYKWDLEHKPIDLMFRENFKDSDVFGCLVAIYSQLYTAFGAKTTKELYENIKMTSVDHTASMRLLDAEHRWELLLQSVDLKIEENHQNQIREGNRQLSDAKSIRMVDCERHVNVTLEGCLNHKYGRIGLFVLLCFYG